MPCFRLSLFQIPSLVSLQTTGKTVNNKILTTLGNIYYAYNYKKTKAALSDTLNGKDLPQWYLKIMAPYKKGT